MSAARPKFGPSLKKHLKHILPLQKHARSLGQLLITSNKPTTPDGHDIMNKEEAALKDARDKKRKHQPTNEAEPKPGKKGAPKAKKPKKEYVPWVGDWKCAICGYWNIPFSATCNGNCRDPDDETEGPCYGKRRRDTEFEQADEEAPREIRRGLVLWRMFQVVPLLPSQRVQHVWSRQELLLRVRGAARPGKRNRLPDHTNNCNHYFGN